MHLSSNRFLRIAAAGVLACGLNACAPKGIEPLAKPTKIDSFCGEQLNVRRYPRTTSMGSILTSVYDEVPSPTGIPSLARYREGLTSTGGAVSHYTRLRLLKPALAHQLGESDDYVVIREVVFTNELAPDGVRYVYVNLRDHGKYRWQALRAADTQNICNDGTRLA